MPTKSKPRYWVLSKPGEPWRWASSKNCEGGSDAPLEVGTHTIRGLENEVRVDRMTLLDFGLLLGTPDMDARAEALANFPIAYILVEGHLEDLATVPPRPGLSLLQALAALSLDHPSVKVTFAGAHGKTYLASFFARLMEWRA